ncbi:MAG: acyl-CoA desaturase [Acidobacteria bacterium]|nr:acyl-CoA desaturase [Acidobacteriota bacterium]MBI3489267.1 acyl-CoA desaturase [Acidobacteriota bacterium]
MAQQPQRSLLNTLFLWGTLVLALILVPLKLARQGLSWSEAGMFGLMYVLIGLSITVGYHRLFSHRAYRAAWQLRLAFLVFGAAAFENSALWWSSDHRQHHRFVDDPKGDPYAISKGFWYAHWVWVMEGVVRPLEAVEDLQKDPLVRWQHRYHFWIGAAVALIPVYVGIATGNIWGHAVIGLLLRIVVTHHSTFLINSAAHRWGSQPYSDANSSRDNALLAPLTFGEGYHNFHHKWQWDYRNSARWYQWDPGKWLITLFAWTGLARDLRRVPETQIHHARLDMEAKRLTAVLATAPVLQEGLRDRLGLAKARIEEALGAFQSRREAWEALRAEWTAKGQARGSAWQALRDQWKSEQSRCRQELRAAWADWKAAKGQVLALDCV